MTGGLQADQSISFQAMQGKAEAAVATSCSATRRCETVVGFTGASGGAGATNTGFGVRVAEAAGRSVTASRRS